MQINLTQQKLADEFFRRKKITQLPKELVQRYRKRVPLPHLQKLLRAHHAATRQELVELTLGTTQNHGNHSGPTFLGIMEKSGIGNHLEIRPKCYFSPNGRSRPDFQGILKGILMVNNLVFLR